MGQHWLESQSSPGSGEVMVQFEVGKLACVTIGCPVAGYRTTWSDCVFCHQPTRPAAEVRTNVPVARPALKDGGQRVMGMMPSVIFGGLWT